MKYSSLFKEVLLVLLRTITDAVYNIDCVPGIEEHCVDFDAETCAVHLTFRSDSMSIEIHSPESVDGLDPDFTSFTPIDEQTTCEELMTFIALSFDESGFDLEWLVELWDQDAVKVSGVLTQIPCPN